MKDMKVKERYQSTSRAGAEWKANCCLQLPVAASQIIVVLIDSTKKYNKYDKKYYKKYEILLHHTLPSWYNESWQYQNDHDLIMKCFFSSESKTCRLLHSEWNFLSCSTSKQILAPDKKIQEERLQIEKDASIGVYMWTKHILKMYHLMLSQRFLQFASRAPDPEVHKLTKVPQISCTTCSLSIVQDRHL